MKKRFRDLAALGLAAVMAAGSLTGCQKEQQPEIGRASCRERVSA